MKSETSPVMWISWCAVSSSRAKPPVEPTSHCDPTLAWLNQVLTPVCKPFHLKGQHGRWVYRHPSALQAKRLCVYPVCRQLPQSVLQQVPGDSREEEHQRRGLECVLSTDKLLIRRPLVTQPGEGEASHLVPECCAEIAYGTTGTLALTILCHLRIY